MQVIRYNKKYADSVNMTLELYTKALGWQPDETNLKSIFNWDSNYREEICRKGQELWQKLFTNLTQKVMKRDFIF